MFYDHLNKLNGHMFSMLYYKASRVRISLLDLGKIFKSLDKHFWSVKL